MPSLPLSPYCVFCGDLGGSDFILNVLLFAPLGLAAGLLFPNRSWVWIVAPLASLAIESLQWKLVPGRDAALGDLIANTLGGTLGALAGVHSTFLALPNTRRARRLAAASGVAVTALLSLAGTLLTPSVPIAVFYVQWVPNRTGYTVFNGQLDSLVVNGVPVGAGDAIDPVFRPTVVGADRNEVRAVVRSSTRGPGGIELIARLAAPGSERFMIGRSGEDFVYQARMRAADARLRVPIGALPGAFRVAGESGNAADTAAIELQSAISDNALHLRARGPVAELKRDLPLSPAVSWAFVYPGNVPLGANYLWWNGLLLMVLVLPTMYWLAVSSTARTHRRDTRRGRAKSAIMLGVFLAALASVHIIGGGAPFSVSEWVGVAAAGGGGWLLSLVTRSGRRHRHPAEDHHGGYT